MCPAEVFDLLLCCWSPVEQAGFIACVNTTVYIEQRRDHWNTYLGGTAEGVGIENWLDHYQ